MANIKEPFVSINTVDETGRLSTVSSDIVVAMVIHSDTGNTEDTLVNSVPELLENYSFKSSVTANDHITFQHAAKLLQFTPIRVTRACSSKIKSGRTDTNQVVFADETYNPFKVGQEVELNNNLTSTGIISIKDGGKDYSISGDSNKLISTLLSPNGENFPVSNWCVEISGENLLIHTSTPSVTVNTSKTCVESVIPGSSISFGVSGSFSTSLALSMGGFSYLTTPSDVTSSNIYSGVIVKVPDLDKFNNLSNSDYVFLVCLQDLFETNRSNQYPKISWNHVKFSTKLTAATYLSSIGITDSIDYSSENTISILKNTTVTSARLDLRNTTVGTTGIGSSIYSDIVINSVKFNSDKLLESSFNYDSSANTPESAFGFISENFIQIGTDNIEIEEVGSEVHNVVTIQVSLGSSTDSFEGFQLGNSIYRVEGLSTGASSATRYDITTPGEPPEVTITDNTLYGTYDADAKTFTFNNIRIKGVQKGFLSDSSGRIEKKGSEVVDWIAYLKVQHYSINEIDVTNEVSNSNSITVAKFMAVVANRFGSITPNASNAIYFEKRYSRGISWVNEAGVAQSDSSNGGLTIGTDPIKEYLVSVASADEILESDIYFKIQPQLRNSEGVWVDTTDSRTFYIGNYKSYDPNEELVRITTAGLTFNDWKHKLVTQLKTYYNVVEQKSGFIILGDGDTNYRFVLGKYGDSTWISNPDWSFDSFNDDYSTALSDSHFIIFNRFPSTQAASSFSVVRDEDDAEVFKLTLTNGVITKNYDISFVEGKVDGYGRQLYYERVNNLSKFFYMTALNGGLSTEVESVPEINFGNEIYVGEPDSTDFINALDNFVWSEKGIYYNILFDGGYANTAYASAIDNKASELYAEGMLCTPPEISDEAQIKEYRKATGIDSWHSFMSCQWSKDTTLGDFTALICRNTYLIERLIANKKGGSEFAPLFWKNNGVVSMTSTFYFNKKEVREDLLGSQINVVAKNLRNDTEYYKMELTMQSKDSDLSDLHNCLMVNAGAHQLDNILDQFIGEFNTSDTRSTVVTSATRAIKNRLLVNQVYKPNDILVVCDSSNNDEDVVNSRYIIADLYYKFEVAIRYAQGWQRVVSITKDLSNVGNPGT